MLSVLTAAYPDKSLEDETVKLYLRFLSDIPFHYGQAAALNMIAESKWFPSVAELRKEAVSLMPDHQIPSAAEAWGEVMEQIRKAGYYGIPEFTHPVVKQAVKTMGWRNLCMMEEGAYTDRAHFMKIYDSLASKETKQSLQIPDSKRLIGEGNKILIGDGADE